MIERIVTYLSISIPKKLTKKGLNNLFKRLIKEENSLSRETCEQILQVYISMEMAGYPPSELTCKKDLGNFMNRIVKKVILHPDYYFMEINFLDDSGQPRNLKYLKSISLFASKQLSSKLAIPFMVNPLLSNEIESSNFNLEDDDNDDDDESKNKSFIQKNQVKSKNLIQSQVYFDLQYEFMQSTNEFSLLNDYMKHLQKYLIYSKFENHLENIELSSFEA